MSGLGAWHNSLVSDSPSASPGDNRKLMSYWRASEASETLPGVYKFELMQYVYMYIYVIVIPWVLVVYQKKTPVSRGRSLRVRSFC